MTEGVCSSNSSDLDIGGCDFRLIESKTKSDRGEDDQLLPCRHLPHQPPAAVARGTARQGGIFKRISGIHVIFDKDEDENGVRDLHHSHHHHGNRERLTNYFCRSSSPSPSTAFQSLR